MYQPRKRYSTPSVLLVPRRFWHWSILNRALDQYGYALTLFQYPDPDRSWGGQISHYYQHPLPDHIGACILGPNRCSPRLNSKQSAVTLLWELQKQLDAAGIPHATIYNPGEAA